MQSFCYVFSLMKQNKKLFPEVPGRGEARFFFLFPFIPSAFVALTSPVTLILSLVSFIVFIPGHQFTIIGRLEDKNSIISLDTFPLLCHLLQYECSLSRTYQILILCLAGVSLTRESVGTACMAVCKGI